MIRVLLIALVTMGMVFVETGLAQEQDLLAHDINGYALGMTVQQVERVAKRPLRSLGAGQYHVSFNGQEYDFGFSVLGRLFRIDYHQNLGRFTPDESYARTLANGLTKKFGPPDSNSLPGGPISWLRSGPYSQISGEVLDRNTLSLSASLLGGWGQPVVLNMELMDYRIMRRDLAKANAAPRSQAERATKF